LVLFYRKMTVLSKPADAKEDEEYAVAFKKCKVLVTLPKSPQIGASSSSSSSSADSGKVGRVLPERVADFTDEDIDYFKRLPTELKKEIVASFPPFTPSKEWLEVYEKWRVEKRTRRDKWGISLCNFVDENGELCTKRVQSSSQFTGIPGRCKRHVGGNRCQKEGCETSAPNSTRCTGLPGMCTDHGGGTRCEHEDETEGENNVQGCCPNSAQIKKGGTPGMCESHGGAKRIPKICLKCGKKAARCSTRKTGIPGMCVACGGDNRCEKPCCTALPGIPTVAKHIHPDTGEGICTAFARNMVAEALFEKNEEDVQRLMKYFDFKRKLVFRAEQAFFCALNKAAPELRQFESAIDTSVLKQFYGKNKSTEDRRPDAFFLCRETNVALHFEYDENTYHEDDDTRLTLIANQAGCGPDAVYVVRVNGHQNTNDSLCTRRIYKNEHAYYELTEQGNQVVTRVADYMKECVDQMKLGILPTLENKKMYF
jgi:hypothetical protein